MKKLIQFLVLGLIAVTFGCQSETTPPATTPATDQAQISPNTIEIKNFSFTPSDLTVTAGTTVTWNQNDSASHTIVSDGLFTSPTLATGKTYSFKFEKAGEYSYYCSIHPSMKGKITVK